MNQEFKICLQQFNPGRVFILCILSFFIFSSTVDAQILRSRKQRDRSRGGGLGKRPEAEWKKNIVWLEGLGSNQVVGFKYERIFNFGPVVSLRFDAGLTPFLLDENYNFVAGRSITPITGMGFYFQFPHLPLYIGLGCSALHDIYFDRIPETYVDTTGGVTNPYPQSNYRIRVMPFAVFEAVIKERWSIRAGYSPIIDPANHGQTETYFTQWATIGFGYRFGH